MADNRRDPLDVRPHQRRRLVLDENDGDGGDDAIAFAGENDGAALAADAGADDATAYSDASGPGGSASEEEGEDIVENAVHDYQAIPALDVYDAADLDDRRYDPLDIDDRLAAEMDMDRREGRTGRVGGALDEFAADEEEGEREARRGTFGVTTGEDDEPDFEENLEAFDVPLAEWLGNPRTKRAVAKKFDAFLTDARLHPDTAPLYVDRIRTLAGRNMRSLEVSYLHLSEREPLLALWLADAPELVLEVFHGVATRAVLRMFPGYAAIAEEVVVRIGDVPISDSIRDLRQCHLNALVRVSGVVTRRGAVHPQLRLARYDCTKCGAVLGPYKVEDDEQSNGGPAGPAECAHCQAEGNPGMGPFRINQMRTVYRNFQKVLLQETPGTVPPGRVPRTAEVVLTADLIDRARPGEEVEVTGAYLHAHDAAGLGSRSGFPVFSTHIRANHVLKREDLGAAHGLTAADRDQILRLARDPRIGERIVRSIAPSIYGHRHVKVAMAMALFSGVPKNINAKHRIRGDINVLLLGDPGTAKSQFLKYCEKTAPRAVYSTGKGASAVGLTASVHKDPVTKEWTLEGGALVLADRGVCLIDEFDKMNEQDRTSIHEAMEQQSISVSKAGIVTSLQARCSVVAAANPIGGRYDSSCTLAENVELTDPILQRFDILCVLRDTVDPVADERLARFVTGSHLVSHPTSELEKAGGGAGLAAHLQAQERTVGGDAGAPSAAPPLNDAHEETIPQHVLRKYIQYARAHVRPRLQGFDRNKVSSLYVALRRESAQSGGVPIAVRHIESIMRMAEAHAKMHLREYVRDDDVDAAVEVMLGSFVSAQKFSVQRGLKKAFAKYLSTADDRGHLLLHVLQDMFRAEALYQAARRVPEEEIGVHLEEFEGRARDSKVYDVGDFLKSDAFKEAGYLVDVDRRMIVRN
eukprot:CAMPEP_0194274018 /NCGR_PEP_ID=MMETSP0169-20130528/7211_1 /TAXON_ID=218684 /ORGANISM="Corethron pennatum, Strain L29A3" /LENGTH=922 /DNA_ID=CAMNT_0039017113 /DNA_START=77 /DNA_END=2845 /DNA_ORIENTATION=+